MKIKNSILFIWLFIGLNANAQNKAIYQDSSKSVELRVNDLMKRMTVDEKVAQLQSQLVFLQDYKEYRDFNVGHFRNIGHFMHGDGPVSAGTCADAINADTKKSIEASRFGIPVLQHGEALHGAQWGQATVFPQCISLAASFDDNLVFTIGQVVAQELRAVGVRQVYAPMVNISRDPRWGRVQETYGEDPFLTSRMGVAYTKALQRGGIIATPKALVDNYGSAGHDSYASDNSWRVLREVFLEPFRACVVEGGAGSVMMAYNSADGVPCTNNKYLIQDILRKEWGFKGFTVSDYGGVLGVYRAHHVTDSYAEAQAQSLQAGLDIELPNGYRDLIELVKSKRVSEKEIDSSVRRVLVAKFKLGLFDHPYVDASAADHIVRSESHRQLSLEAARKTMTLLKNKNQTLPLDENKIKRIAVFGPAANILSLGDYTGPYGGWKGEGAVTPYQGLVNRLKDKTDVILFQPGMNADSLAKKMDAVIFFGAITEGEAQDRSQLTLPNTKQSKEGESKETAIIVEKNGAINIESDQEAMIEKLASTGVKTIVVLENGAPIDIHNWSDKVDAVLEAWYPGEQGGIAIAETIFGDNNPAGRLPISWPRHAGQIPIYYAVKPSGRNNTYIDDDGKPQFPFGFGLSYTSFSYSNLIVPQTISKDEENNKNDSIQVRVTVTNTGSLKGDEVVQLYLHQELADVVRPVKELKAFKRISLNAGESREVILNLPYQSFGYWNKDLQFVVTPGMFKVYVARDAEHTVMEGQINIPL